MDKITALAFTVAATVGAATSAFAVDFKMDGEMLYQFQTASIGFAGKNEEFIAHRMRVGMSMAACEYLSGYLKVEMGEDRWGTAINEHGAQAENSNDVREMYVDWGIPGTEAKVRMGRHEFSMPGYVFCSPVIAYHAAEGMVLDLPIDDTFSLTGFWTRAVAVRKDNEDRTKDFDAFGLIGKAGFASFDVAPWLVYASKDSDVAGDIWQSSFQSEASAEAFIFGMSVRCKSFATMMLEFDTAWGKVAYGPGEEQDDKGWYVAAGCSYAFDFATPALKFWYASGDKSGRRAQSGHLPSIFGDCDASNMFFDGAPGIIGGNRTSIGGTWGASARLNRLSFFEDLTHDLSVTYVSGTNGKGNVGKDYGTGYSYLTSKDTAFEFAAVNTFQIYKELAAIFEAAYIIEDFDTSTDARNGETFENDWRLSMTFAYTF